MRRLLLLFTLFTTIAATAQQSVRISGKIGSLAKGDKVYVRQLLSGDRVDSLIAEGKSFSMVVPVEKSGLYNLQIVGDTRSSLLLYLQPGKVRIKGKSLSEAGLSGSPFIRDFNSFTQSLKKHEFLKQFSALNGQYGDAVKKRDTALRNKLIKQLRSLSPAADSVRTALASQWMEEHPQSDINAYVVYMNFRRKKTHAELQQILDGLSAGARNSSLAEAMYHSIEVAKVTAIGNMAPDFTQNDPTGKPVSLKDFRGKYVLVDFWASWCGPCRAENPNVVEAHKKFMNKNFTVLGVSLDNNKTKWLEAIDKDRLEWSHVSDLKYWNNAVAKQYDINAIPANLLIDPSGKIVAKNLRGDALHKKLEELMN